MGGVPGARYFSHMVLFTIILGVIQFFLAGLGIYVSLKSPAKKWHWVLILIFSGFAVASIGITGYQEYQNMQANDDLKSQVTRLVNASTTQATTDDIKQLASFIQAGMQTGFDRVVFAIKGKTESSPEPNTSPVPGVQVPVPTVENTRLVQRSTTSDKSDLPYGLQVIVQSNVAIQPVAIAFECDGEVGDFNFFIAGQTVYMNFWKRISGKIAELKFSFPPLTPENSLVVTLFSKKQIRVVKAYKMHP
jgi:hypothetical protein